MTLEKLTEITYEQGQDIEHNKADISELMGRVEKLECATKEHGTIVESIYELALSIKELTGQVNNIDNRLGIMEQETRDKRFATWQIIISAILGGGLTFAITKILGG